MSSGGSVFHYEIEELVSRYREEFKKSNYCIVHYDVQVDSFLAWLCEELEKEREKNNKSFIFFPVWKDFFVGGDLGEFCSRLQNAPESFIVCCCINKKNWWINDSSGREIVSGISKEKEDVKKDVLQKLEDLIKKK